MTSLYSLKVPVYIYSTLPNTKVVLYYLSSLQNPNILHTLTQLPNHVYILHILQNISWYILHTSILQTQWEYVYCHLGPESKFSMVFLNLARIGPPRKVTVASPLHRYSLIQQERYRKSIYMSYRCL